MRPKIAFLAIMAHILAGAAVADGVVSGGPGPEKVRRVADTNGPNPLAEMTAYTGRAFEWQYMMSMWKQDSGIACIAAVGTCRASCQPLRDLSARIVQEQLALNNGLEWASLEFTNAPKPCPCGKRFVDLEDHAQQLSRSWLRSPVRTHLDGADAPIRGSSSAGDPAG